MEGSYMKNTFLIVACASAILGVVAISNAHAEQTSSHETFLAFSAPFALPGVSLPAGTYRFEIVDTPGALNVVRVRSMDRRQVYLTALTLPVSRPRVVQNDHQISFAEVRTGMTPPVKVWYPLTDSVGHQFIYPKHSAQLGTR
jgi:hypothetical protein